MEILIEKEWFYYMSVGFWIQKSEFWILLNGDSSYFREL